jgi:hypothetical protein
VTEKHFHNFLSLYPLESCFFKTCNKAFGKGF